MKTKLGKIEVDSVQRWLNLANAGASAVLVLGLASHAQAGPLMEADLNILKSDPVLASDGNNPGVIDPGDQIIYTITVTNFGPNDASNVDVIDSFPTVLSFDPTASTAGWSCGTTECTLSAGTIAANSGFTLDIAFFVLDPFADNPADMTFDILNVATLTSETLDPNPDDNTSSSLAEGLSPAKAQAPEPASLALFAIALGGLGFMTRRRTV